MPVRQKRLRSRLASLVLSVTLLGGCATGTTPGDPFESMNRGIYSFNEGLDNAILKPTAQAYRAVLPQFIRSSVSNFFSNINDVVVALNNLLQGKFTAAYSDLGRVAINSTIGILGLFDVASEAGIEKHDEDFGQTLGRWGVANGPYLMLPFFGPSTGRDAVGRFVDYKTDLAAYVDPTRSRNQLWGTRVVNRRSELLDASNVLQTAALDPYEFVRDAYLQRRRNLIYDGTPPSDREFLDAPPKAQQRWKPHVATFPVTIEATDHGTVLVHAETPAPGQASYSEAPRAAPANAGATAQSLNRGSASAVAMRVEGSPLLIGEPPR